MGDIVKTGSKYSDEQRMEVAVLYAVSGNAKKVAKATGIPRTTIVGWKKADWWDDLVAQVRSENTARHRAEYSKIVDLAQKQTIKELPNATAQQASIISGVAFDKLRLIDNQPTSISSNQDSKTLAEACIELSRTMREKQVNVVAVQDKSDEEE